MSTSYKLTLYCYNGMRRTIVQNDDYDACRWAARREINYHRMELDCPVTVLTKGFKWELETGEDACMIGDHDGILEIVEIAEEPEEEPEEEPGIFDEFEFADDLFADCEDCGCGRRIDDLDDDGVCPDCRNEDDDDEAGRAHQREGD